MDNKKIANSKHDDMKRVKEKQDRVSMWQLVELGHRLLVLVTMNTKCIRPNVLYSII